MLSVPIKWIYLQKLSMVLTGQRSDTYEFIHIIPLDMVIRVGRKTLFWKVQGTTSGKLASYSQMDVCKTLARSVKPRHERFGDE